MSRNATLALGLGAGVAATVVIWRKTRCSTKEAAADGEEELTRDIKIATDKAKSLSLQKRRIAKLIEAASDQAPPVVAEYIRAAAPYFGWTVVVIEGCLWVYWKGLQIGWHAYHALPMELATAVTGATVCFFGGAFPTLIAASEAFTQSGWEQTKQAVADLVGEAATVIEASRADDVADDDASGTPDVDEITSRALLTRKTLLVLKTVDPDKIDAALKGLAASWAAVAAVLKVEFARTIALANAISGRLQAPLGAVMVPVLTHVLPPDYHKWIRITVDYIARGVGTTLAWKLQAVISAFHSSIRGGLMCTGALVDFAGARGWVAFKHDETMIDELLGWPLAAAGFWSQLRGGFSLKFPLNYVLLPFTAAEVCIEWAITNEARTST